MKHLKLVAPVVLAAALGAACTMKETEAPPFAGPSEFGKSVGVAITPDIITQDGASQSIVTVTVLGPNSEPVPNVPLRAEIIVNGTPADFGTLSARNIVTGADGKATLVYTAPPGVSGVSTDDFTIVTIGVTPLGTDFANSTMRSAQVRLVPRGTIVVPGNLRPAFTFTPAAPGESQAVVFDASTSTAPANNPIVQYLWDFGDGGTASGVTVTHAYSRADNYAVTLTVVDGVGRAAQTSRSVTVTASLAPTANFVSSPAAPLRGTPVVFNASSSTAATGRRIVSYVWDFGDPNATPTNPNTGSGVAPSHVYAQPGAYTVTLTVTDDQGRTNSRSGNVTVN
jgi:PKD repeat protein